MEPLVLMGDEALAQGALDAGIAGAFGYPGTPSTEIFEYVQAYRDRPVYARWSANEKTALEEALGMSFAGARALVSMKHVGLNVAADPFMNAAITGANGGLLIAVADDPGMHSSQNEQDSRYYAAFGHVPCLEPATQQEAYEMGYAGLDLSERLGLPVMVRLVTRLAHSRAPVVPKPAVVPPRRPVVSDPTRYTLLPVNARRHWAALAARWPLVAAAMAELPWNELRLAGRRLGVVASGIAHNYVMENLEGEEDLPSVLKVGAWPAPRDLLSRLFDHVDEVLVVEDGYPFLEEALLGALGHTPKPVHGRLDGRLPRTGELHPTNVRAALGLPVRPTLTAPLSDLSGRPPALCPGCPHADTYLALNAAMATHPEGRVFSDIGCYTLGALPPFRAIHTCVDMGASVSMALGAAQAGVHPSVAVIGDSTFGHSGMTPLLDAVRADAPMLVIILDNATVAMTGQQETACSGERLLSILRGLGVDPAHLRVVNPLRKHHEENVRILCEEIAHPGLSVVVPTRACIQIRK
ncbi:MAG: indolepyruvate ferredoxin oxidoreductase [Deltaproteobacteria bacterium]|nr:indolepyruvate ferredoxin oxidoreductase [Deltaproteobacteria bacterium]